MEKGRLIINGVDVSGSVGSAASVPYSNTNSGLEATNTQGAIDELATSVTELNSNISNNTMTLLWENSAPAESFAEQTLTIPEIVNSNTLLIRYSSIALGVDFSQCSVLAKRNDSVSGYMSTFARYDSKVYVTTRYCTIDWENGTILFSTATQNGSNSNNRHIPIDIYKIN